MDSNEGVIEVHKIGKVFTVNNKTLKVEYKVKEKPLPSSQKWDFGFLDGNHWQTIKHSETNLYLTARYNHPSSILVIEDEIGI